ncbi:HTH domain-containing protein [Clostridiales bacterium COT073_COT-073]|nr:HTH domain-containing protein [Clostridiales bacterium COT073_COT-073]
MNKRILDMVDYIENNSGKSSLRDLAAEFNVSTKTVHQDISVISQFLSKKQIGEIINEEGNLMIKGERAIMQEILNKLSFSEYVLSKEERLIIEALLLLFAEDYLILAEIADFCSVSRTTVITDLNELNENLKEEKLMIHGYSSRGIKLCGQEIDIRKYFLKCSSEQEYLLQLFFNQLKQEEKAEHIFLKDSERIILQNLVAEAEQRSGNFLTEGSYQTLMKYLLFFVQRMRKNQYLLENVQRSKRLPDPKIDLFPEFLYNYICQYFDFMKSEEEYQLFCKVTQNLRYIQKSNLLNRDTVKIQTITRKFIEKLSNELHIKLYRDYDLFIGLSRHLERMFEEKITFISKYQEVKVIINKNPELLKIVENNINLIEQVIHRKITEAELDFIVVYVYAAMERLRSRNTDFRVLLICNSGIGTSQLLKSRLTERFAFQVTAIKSSHSLTEQELNEVDFAISTVELPFPTDKYIKVSPLLTEEDHIALIRQIDSLPKKDEISKDPIQEIMWQIEPIISQYEGLMESIEDQIKTYFHDKSQKSGRLTDFLTSEFLLTGVEAADWKKAIAIAAEPLLTKGYIEPGYIQAMIKNVEENGAYIVIAKGFALAHAGIDEGSLKVGLSLAKLKTPVEFGAGLLDPVYYVAVLSAIDEKQHLNPFFELLNLLRIQSFAEELELSQTKQDIQEVIKKYESRM